MERDIFSHVRRAAGVLRSLFLSTGRARNGSRLSLYMTLDAIFRLFGGEGLFTIMARAAKFLCVKRLHCHLGRSGLLFHLKDLRVTLRTLELFLRHIKLVTEEYRI